MFLHSCGGIYELLPGLIDAGIDVLNPVQTSARGMDPERLKREFGDKLCFWGGGCDTQTVLPFGTPEEVYANTRRNIEIFKPGGCDRCNQTGYRGRIGIFEILLMDEEIRALVLRRASADEIAAEAVGKGMRRLREDGLEKVRRGLTSPEEVLRVTASS